jgi:pyruvate dehydrogenase E2 component (dihydrolipoamide acetyltransferase)
LDVDLRRIQGSGRRGRITPEDVWSAAALAGAPSAAAARDSVRPEPITPPGEPGEDAWGPVRRDRMSKIRRTIAAQMVQSSTRIPHVTNFDDADVTNLEQLRKDVPRGYLGNDLKLTMMPFVIKAVVLALQHHPTLNASLDEENGQVIYKQYVHLGVAVDTPRGLVVPAIRNVDRLSIPQIARELSTVAERARAAQFAVEDLRGGTFTISNMGAVGGIYSTPIINYPEVAVLLLGRSRRLPVVRDGQIVQRFMLPLSLSYDHRLVDGAAASRFLNEVIDYLQSPGKLLLSEQSP